MSLLSNRDSKTPMYINFIIGGISGLLRDALTELFRYFLSSPYVELGTKISGLEMGQTATHPLDVLKVRIQIAKTSLTETIKETWKAGGFKGFYTGWTAGLLRQLTYSTTRFGIYNTTYDFCMQRFEHLNYPTMVGIGMIAGIAGAFVGTPCDLVLIRMVADVKAPPEKRRNYRNVITGLYDIWKADGLFGLWKGAVPTMTRAAIVNGAQLGTYTKAKIILLETGHLPEGLFLQFLAAMISGMAMCVSSLPVDVAKTRIQNWGLPAKPPGIIAMLINIAKTEGVLSLWRGFLPYYSRAAPNTVVTMICIDQLHHIYAKLFIVSD